MNTIIQPPYLSLINNTTIIPWSPECLAREFNPLIAGTTSGVWTANLLEFIPLLLVEPLVVSQFFWKNGATTNGNTDIGIYSFDGQTKLGSTGSTANSGTNQIQIVDVTNFQIPPNARLWLAIGSDSGTQTYFRTTLAISALEFMGMKQQASGWSSGLPATITPATATVAVTPLFGFTGASVV